MTRMQFSRRTRREPTAQQSPEPRGIATADGLMSADFADGPGEGSPAASQPYEHAMPLICRLVS
jgi:hypothetical protein